MTPDDHTREAAYLYLQCRAESLVPQTDLAGNDHAYTTGPTALAMRSGQAWRYLGRSDELAGLDGYGRRPGPDEGAVAG